MQHGRSPIDSTGAVNSRRSRERVEGNVRELSPSEVDRRGYTALGKACVFRHLQIGDNPPCPAIGEPVSFKGSAWGSFDMCGTVLAISSCGSEKLNLVVVGPEWVEVDAVGALEFLRDTLAGIEESDRKRRAESRSRRERPAFAPVPNYGWELRRIEGQIYSSARAIVEHIHRNRTLSAALLTWWVGRNHGGLALVIIGLAGAVLGLSPIASGDPISVSVAVACGLYLCYIGLYRFLGGRT